MGLKEQAQLAEAAFQAEPVSGECCGHTGPAPVAALSAQRLSSGRECPKGFGRGVLDRNSTWRRDRGFMVMAPG